MKIYEECRLGNFHFKRIIEENIIFVRNLKNIVSSSTISNYNPVFIHVLLDIITEFEDELGEEIKRLSK